MQVPILLLRGARSFLDAKKMKKKEFVSLDFGDNPIHPISNPDGQDREVKFFGGKRLTFYSYPTYYGHFPTRNGLKLRKLSS